MLSFRFGPAVARPFNREARSLKLRLLMSQSTQTRLANDRNYMPLRDCSVGQVFNLTGHLTGNLTGQPDRIGLEIDPTLVMGLPVRSLESEPARPIAASGLSQRQSPV